MTMLIHLLGADIPHHNLTVLTFFNNTLAVDAPVAQPRTFWVVNCPPQVQQALPALNIVSFADKKALAQAVSARARQDRASRFFCHGQFNLWLWLALLRGALRPQQMLWHIWGADLYEDRSGWRFQLFYRLRRLAQRRVGAVFATQGDLTLFQQRNSRAQMHKLYFPTRMPALPPSVMRTEGEPLTLLLGNSGDISNRHLDALAAIHRQFGREVRIVIPMGYPDNNARYIDQVESAALALFPAENINVLRNKLAFEDYLALIARCDLGYFIFRRQQGIGTLCLLIQACIPFVISPENPFGRDLQDEQIPLLLSDMTLTREQVSQARRQLTSLDKSTIAFFDPGFVQGWKAMLSEFEDRNA